VLVSFERGAKEVEHRIVTALPSPRKTLMDRGDLVLGQVVMQKCSVVAREDEPKQGSQLEGGPASEIHAPSYVTWPLDSNRILWQKMQSVKRIMYAIGYTCDLGYRVIAQFGLSGNRTIWVMHMYAFSGPDKIPDNR